MYSYTYPSSHIYPSSIEPSLDKIKADGQTPEVDDTMKWDVHTCMERECTRNTTLKLSLHVY